MTPNSCRHLAIVTACALSFTLSQGASLTGLRDLSGRDVDGIGAGESNGTFSSPKTFSATTDFSLRNVAWADGAYSGVIDISFVVATTGTPTATLVASPIKRGGKGAFGISSNSGNDGLLGSNEGTLTFSDIQLTHVSGDTLDKIDSVRFAAIYLGNNQVSSGADAALVNGFAITNNSDGGDTTGAMRNDFAPADSFELAITQGELSVNGLDFLVTSVGGPTNAPPSFTNASFDVPDGAPISNLVATLAGFDNDGPQALEYTITAGNDDNAFALDAASGELTVNGPISFAQQATYALMVEASDGADSTPATITINVLAPPVTVTAAGSVTDEPDWVSAGFGGVGYLFAGTDDNDLAVDLLKLGGAVYSTTESPAPGHTVEFSLLNGTVYESTRIGGNPTNPLSASINTALENPDGGTFVTGNMNSSGLEDNAPSDLFLLTFHEAVPDGYRLAILVGAHELQGLEGDIDGTNGNLRDIPSQIAVDAVRVPTSQGALDTTPSPDWGSVLPAAPDSTVPRADWYCFDLTDITAGSSVTVSASRIYADYSHKFNPVNGFALSAIPSTTAEPSITGVTRTADLVTIDFTGDPGLTDWKVMAGTDLQDFSTDKTPASFTEDPAGNYQAQVDVSGDPATFFLRIER